MRQSRVFLSLPKLCPQTEYFPLNMGFLFLKISNSRFMSSPTVLTMFCWKGKQIGPGYHWMVCKSFQSGEQVSVLANLHGSTSSKSFQIFLSNQKLARALASTLKAFAPANTSCCLATFLGANTAGSVQSRRREFAINWYLFPRPFHSQAQNGNSPHWLPNISCENLLVHQDNVYPLL